MVHIFVLFESVRVVFEKCYSINKLDSMDSAKLLIGFDRNPADDPRSNRSVALDFKRSVKRTRTIRHNLQSDSTRLLFDRDSDAIVPDFQENVFLNLFQCDANVVCLGMLDNVVNSLARDQKQLRRDVGIMHCHGLLAAEFCRDFRNLLRSHRQLLQCGHQALGMDIDWRKPFGDLANV